MYKRFQMFTPIIITLMVLSALIVLITPFFNLTLFFISAAIVLLVFAGVLVMLRRVGLQTRAMLEEISRGISRTNEGDYIQFPLPVLTVYEGSEVIWYNQQCYEQVFSGHDLRGEHIQDVLPGLQLAPEHPELGQDIVWGQRSYTAFVAPAKQEDENISIIYMVDDTNLKRLAEEYEKTRLSIAIIMVDNYDEMIQDYKDSERAQFMSEIENAVEQYLTLHQGYFTRIARDKFLCMIEEQGFEKIVEAKFDLLDKVRAMAAPGRMGATLSIGVGHNAANLREAEQMARQALDMCLGRGGDQVAIKTQNGYDFYGGVSKGVEKRTKVKTRIIATALAELIETAQNVILMGHRFADLDALGSCIGMLKSVMALDRPGVICIDQEKNLVRPLLDKLQENGYPEEYFVSPEQALTMINEKTLLIVLDTHVPHVLESQAVYQACKTVVVIDHHRKLVSYIDNAVIFYHEPYASSASEMVTELMQYFPAHPQVNKLEAEALLAGIMLDTKNFVLRTGVRTFEAAAYLRRLGADTVEVRQLFSSSMQHYQHKSHIVAGAEIYCHCAIAATKEEIQDIRIVAPQAADELMDIDGVYASFVLYPYGNSVNVSARSMGAINVQIMMESLGGGGHHTMAAAQFENETIEAVGEKIKQAIDHYYASQPQHAV